MKKIFYTAQTIKDVFDKFYEGCTLETRKRCDAEAKREGKATQCKGCRKIIVTVEAAK